MDETMRLRRVVSLAGISWCEFELEKNVWLFSKELVTLLGLSGEWLASSDFIAKVREDYQAQVSQEFGFLFCRAVLDVKFPVKTPSGNVWLHLYLNSCTGKQENQKSILGYIQRIESLEKSGPAGMESERMNNLLYQQNAISRYLLDFLRNGEIDEVINSTLAAILQQFQGGRAYIFEYDNARHIQRNTYEVVNGNVAPQMHLLQNLSTDMTPWWNRQMAELRPIVLNTMADFPPEVTEEEIRILVDQGINSLMVVPLVSGEQTWGYIGIDVVAGSRQWSRQDYHWFASLANIISICIELRKAKDNAIYERRFLHNLYTHIPMGYLRISFVKDKGNDTFDCRLTDVNELGAKFTGKPLRDYIGRQISTLELGDGINTEMLVQLCEENKHKEIDLYYPASGKYCHGILYSPEMGEVVILLLDITAAIEADKIIERSQRMFKNIFDSCPIGIEIYDKEGYLIDLNYKDLEIFGVSRESALGLNFFANPNVPVSIKEQVRNNESVDFRLSYSFKNVEGERYYSSVRGGKIDLYSKISPLYDAQGNFIHYLLINIDNTKQHDAITRIHDFENYFLLISDYAKIGYVKVNLITKKGYAIQQWYKNIGEESDKDLKDILSNYKYIHPDDRKYIFQFYENAIAGKQKSYKAEIRVRKPGTVDGWRWLRVNTMVTVYRPKEGEVEIIGVNYDVTEQKETELKLIEAKNKAETMDRLKSAFLANMSHEIRTPLNAIVGFSSLLLETEDMEERKQYVSIVQKNNECLLQLISDVLDLSKIESGSVDINYTDVNVYEVCQDIRQSLSMKVDKDVELSFDPDLPEYHIFSDAYRIRQVICNFVTNAIKFTSEGFIKIGYELLEDKELLIYVQDSGIGIPREKLNDIFERFVKLDDFVQGTGLGLSICRSIIERLHGKIGVESEQGKGSRFWFTLPYILN